MRRMMTASVLSLLWVASTIAAEPVASTDGEMPGLKLEVQELKVGGNTATLRFTILNDSDQPFGLNDSLKESGSADWHSTDGVYLIDDTAKKKYLVVRDSDKHCVCSRNLADLPAKSKGTYWTKFPAPPENVKTIGVVVPHFVPMDDVPVSR